MIEFLKEASKFLVLPTALLYLLGFLCVTGYYGQFGIVTFEIANARFLIAGMFTALPLGLAAYGAWQISHLVKAGLAERTLNRLGPRCKIYAAFVFFPFMFTYPLLLAFLLARRGSRESGLKLEISPLLGNADFVGNPLASIVTSVNEVTWLLFYSANLGGLLLVAWVFYEAAREVGFLLSRTTKAPPVKPEAASPNTVTAASNPKNESAQGTSPTEPDKRPQQLMSGPEPRWVRAVDVLCLSVLLILFFYSGQKIYSEIFDLSAVGQELKLHNGLLFAWLFSATIFTFLLIAPFVLDGHLAPAQLAKDQLQFNRFTDLLQFILVPLIALVFFFGATVFPKIPFSIGGGEPREVAVTTKTGEWKRNAKVYLLGESSEFLFLVVSDKEQSLAFELRKSEVQEVRTRVRTKSPLSNR